MTELDPATRARLETVAACWDDTPTGPPQWATDLRTLLAEYDALHAAQAQAAPVLAAAQEIHDKGTYNEDCPCDECCAFETAGAAWRAAREG